MDFLSVLWSILSFSLGLIWSLVWFVLRDLISTAVWILIVVWLVLGVRYRSFSAGSLALVRYGRYGFGHFWRWLRGHPQDLLRPRAAARDRDQRRRSKRRIPFGYMSVSEQLNMLIVGAIYLLIYG